VLEKIPFSVDKLCRESLQLFSSRAAQKALRLDCSIDANLPPALVGDPVRLRQVLLNLIGNAIKFTEAAASRSAPVASQPASRTLPPELAVTDTGIGIPQDKLKLIFEAFTQADISTTRRFGGTGLGLSISNRLVGMMGGQISVSSQPGHGSTFTVSVELPVADNTVVAVVPAAPVGNATSRPLSILLVEDNALNQRVASQLLSRDGHRVTVANDGQEALDRPGEAITPDPDGHADAGHGRPDGDPAHPPTSGTAAMAGAHIDDRQRPGQRPSDASPPAWTTS
jgi:hypothetical protein